jgi:hypothetical protein
MIRCKTIFVTANPLRGNERLIGMPLAKRCASTILCAFYEAEAELVGKAVILSDGKAGTVEIVSLDEGHGILISIRGHTGRWPVSTIKFVQSEFKRG